VVPSYEGPFIVLSISESTTQISPTVDFLRFFEISSCSVECVFFKIHLLLFSADSVRLVEIENFNKIFKNFWKNTHSTEHEKFLKEILNCHKRITGADI